MCFPLKKAMTEMRNLLSKSILAAALVAAVSCAKEAEVRLPSLVSDGMVLQRDVPVKVWGWADPGSVVKVKWHGKTVKAVAGSATMFVALLKSTPA